MAKKEINSDISVDGQIMLTNVPNGTGNFLTYNLVDKAISQRTNAEVISDLGLITASNIASAYYTKAQLQTSGQAQVHWGNLTNVPASFTPSVHNHDDRYHLKSESVNMFVGLNGVQTINDTKTFSSSPVVPTPTLNTHAVNKIYVDGNFIPNSQKNQPNGVAGLDGNLQLHNDRLPNWVRNKYIMLSGEYGDQFISGFRDRNLLIGAFYNASQFDIVLTGSGIVNDINGTKKILTNSKSNFIDISNTDATTQLEITIVFPTLFNNFSNGSSWQAIVEHRLLSVNMFRDIKVETIGTEGVWNECYNHTNVSNQVGGFYAFPVGEYNFDKNYPTFPYGIKGVRITLSNPSSSSVYLSNIIFRHLSNDITPQFPHITEGNTFYENNEFKKPIVVPNAVSNNQAVNLGQLGSYVTTSDLNTQLNNYVTKAGAVTIDGTKTFTESPVVPNPTLNAHAVNKGYIDTELAKKSEKNTDEEWYSTKRLTHPSPFMFKLAGSKSWVMHKPAFNYLIFAPSTTVNNEDWDWTKQIAFRDDGRMKCNGFEIAGYDDNYVNTSGGNQAHKRDLLWTKKDTYDADGSTTVITPKGLLTTIHISGNTDTSTRFVLPRSATNGQRVLFINDSSATWVEVYNPTETLGTKSYTNELLEFTFITESDGEGVMSSNGYWYAYSHTDGKIKL